jgi:hypothetical protein
MSPDEPMTLVQDWNGNIEGIPTKMFDYYILPFGWSVVSVNRKSQAVGETGTSL